MGVYIKDMEMPTRCFNCPLCEISDAEICCSISIGVAVKYTEIDEQIAIQGKPSWCPLVEVKPHGRLIDADAATMKIWEDMRFPSNLANAQFFVNELREMPTIIKSEGKE